MKIINIICEALMLVGALIATSTNHWDKALYFAIMAIYFDLKGGK